MKSKREERKGVKVPTSMQSEASRSLSKQVGVGSPGLWVSTLEILFPIHPYIHQGFCIEKKSQESMNSWTFDFCLHAEKCSCLRFGDSHAGLPMQTDSVFSKS